MCAGFPSYSVIPAAPESLSALKEATPVAQRRVTFASSPFVVRFDRATFEKHLDLQVRILELLSKKCTYT